MSSTNLCEHILGTGPALQESFEDDTLEVTVGPAPSHPRWS